MLKSLARFILWAGRWEVIGGTPDVAKAIVIAVPHTSNWDGFWALTYTVAVDLDIHLFAKQSLFWFPLGALLRGLGGIPLSPPKTTPGGTTTDCALYNDSSVPW